MIQIFHIVAGLIRVRLQRIVRMLIHGRLPATRRSGGTARIVRRIVVLRTRRAAHQVQLGVMASAVAATSTAAATTCSMCWQCGIYAAICLIRCLRIIRITPAYVIRCVVALGVQLDEREIEGYN